MDHNQDRRRGHFYRGRRGHDRRGQERRTVPPPQVSRDQVDVEQVMREIRSRIATRQGVELSYEQIQDLAARKLESILDPRVIKPSMLESLRRGAGEVSATSVPKPSSEPVFTFEDTTLYDSHRGLLRFIRRLLNPLLKLFFNPNPLIRALHLQARLNVEAATRDAERDRRQAEWNALHYDIVQRVVTEMSRLSLEVQALSTRIESLAARVDFADRRVRSLEATGQQGTRPPARPSEAVTPTAPLETPAPDRSLDGPMSEGARRRRRRRRGRRGGVSQSDNPSHEAAAAAGAAPGTELVGDSMDESSMSEDNDHEVDASAADTPADEPAPQASAPATDENQREPGPSSDQ